MYFSAIIFEILLQLCIDYPQLNWIYVKRFKENKSTGVWRRKDFEQVLISLYVLVFYDYC